METLPQPDPSLTELSSSQTDACCLLIKAVLSKPEIQAELAAIRLRLQSEKASSQAETEKNQVAIGGA
jgi:hypothetical protein